jgi:hypothetical protein
VPWDSLPAEWWRVLSPVYPPIAFFFINALFKWLLGFSVAAAGADICLLSVTLEISQYFRISSCATCDQAPRDELVGMFIVSMLAWSIAIGMAKPPKAGKLSDTLMGKLRILLSYVVGAVIFGWAVQKVVPLLSS